MLKNKYTFYLLSFGLSAGLIILAFVFQDKLVNLKTWGLLGVFLLNFFSTITLFVPNLSLATVVAGGSVYNPILVAIVATLGGALGDCTSYILGKSGKQIFIKEEGRFFEFISRIFKEHGVIVLFLFALVPNPIFDALGILAGSLNYSFKKYFLAMLLGRLIRNLILAFVGKSL